MTIRLAVVALALAAAVGPARAETDRRLEAFWATCIPDRQDFEATKRRAESEGWARAEGNEHPGLAAVLAASARMIDPEPGVDMALASYGRTAGGQKFYLVVTHVMSEIIDFVGCYLYDFDTTTPVDIALITELAGAPPGEKKDEPGTIRAHKWDTPEALPGTWDIFESFIPKDSPVIAQAGFGGQVLKISSVDPKDK
jgi:hypothetical protein